VLVGAQKPGQAPKVPAVLVRLSKPDYLSIAVLAEDDGTSLAGYIRRLVRHHLVGVGRAS
jgi:hypothetical protein